MLYTILQIVTCQALFLLVYDFVLRKETFFNYNRAYLLITTVLSFILPFIKFPELKNTVTKDLVIQLPEVFIGTKAPSNYDVSIAEKAGIVLEQPEIPLWQIILGAGIGVAGFIFLLKMFRLYWLKHKNPKRWKGNILIVNLLNSTAAFSFFSTIFLGEKISTTERNTIYKHELVHVKQWHSLDLLCFELLRILFWFNPLVYIYQMRIKELHEFIADAKAVKQNGKAEYYERLLNQIFDVNHISFTNTFFKSSLIKKRIVMLQKSKSKQWHLLKYALLIPLVFGMLIYTSLEVKAQDKNNNENALATQELSDEAIIKKYYSEIAEKSQASGSFIELRNTYNYTERKYIPTKDEYLKYVAFTRYHALKFKEYSENSGKKNQLRTLQFDEMINFNRSYEAHLEYLKSEEARSFYRDSNYNRTLQVISKDIDNLTEEEHKDAYEKVNDVLYGRLYKKLIVKDGSDNIEITKENYDGLIRLFSPQELQVLLSECVNKEGNFNIETEEVPFSVVDVAPTPPKCSDERDNTKRKSCFNDFVTKFINKNFNTGLAKDLSPGRKRVFVQFKIDTLGKVKDIIARGPSEILEVEAKRVIALLPKFTPGEQRGELITVPFSLPIVFQVADKSPNIQKEIKTLENQRDRILRSSTEKNLVIIQLNRQIDSLKQVLIKTIGKGKD
ncbi:M56 family metallopeptidase [uncultured Winogradskyella sp.]|uniref:M56 family metallopeptidase n=1 Tax=uncultured Winogradskyella sp. TaxID=395353 RepID=UPI00261521E8|nr:M56 family metallopeptidase [uncultured Winogradskyella sp.]